MILTNTTILREVSSGTISIEPFNEKQLNINSYDVRLQNLLAVYKKGLFNDLILDAKKDNPIEYIEIPDDGIVLHPNKLYLGSTIESSYTKSYVPMLEGKSSIGRLGIDIHATAGFGDVGFCGHWTLEISVKQKVRVYAGMRIGQLVFHEITEAPTGLYGEKGNYHNQLNVPVASKSWKQFD